MVQASEETQSEFVPVADFRKFQSEADRKLSDFQRRYEEEVSINDGLHQELAGLREQVAQLRERDYADRDPEVVAAIKRAEAAEAKLRQSSTQMQNFGSRYKQAQAEAAALRYGTDDATREQITNHILAAKNVTDLDGRIEQVREWAATTRAQTQAPPPPPRADEVDAGRGRGGGTSTRITQAMLAEHKQDADGGLAWYRANRDAINEAAARGMPER